MSLKKVELDGNGAWQQVNIDDFQIGGSEVQAAYLGSNLVYYNTPDGAILTLEISNGGSQLNIANGTYLFDTLVSFGGSGSGGEFVGVLTSGVLTSIGLVNPFGEGQGWTVNDTIIIENQTFTIGGSNPQIRVLSVK